MEAAEMGMDMWKQENEEIRERYDLCMERVRTMRTETSVAAPFYDFFQKIAEYPTYLNLFIIIFIL